MTGFNSFTQNYPYSPSPPPLSPYHHHLIVTFKIKIFFNTSWLRSFVELVFDEEMSQPWSFLQASEKETKKTLPLMEIIKACFGN